MKSRQLAALSTLSLFAALQFAAAAAHAVPYDPNAAYVPPTDNIDYELRASTAIPAVLISSVDPSSTGSIEGQVTANVYDSETGQVLLIPQGSKLIGTIDPETQHQDNHELVLWSQIILPNGYYLTVQPSPEAPIEAAVITYDPVEGRYVKIPTDASLATIFMGGTALTPDEEGQPSDAISIPPGFLFNVMLTKDVEINPAGSPAPAPLTPLPAAIPIPPAPPVVAATQQKPISLMAVAAGEPLHLSSAPAAPALSSPIAPAPIYVAPKPPEQIWVLNANSLIGGDLKSWGQTAGWTVLWNASQDWPVPTTSEFSDSTVPKSCLQLQSSFERAACGVLNTMSEQGANIRGQFFTGNHTLLVFQPGDANAAQ